MAISSVTATGFSSSFHGSWGTSIVGEDYATMVAMTRPSRVRVGKPLRSGPMMGNVNEGKGLFAPLVVITRNIVGKKRFNQLRGKAIALHSQVFYSYLNDLFVFVVCLLELCKLVVFYRVIYMCVGPYRVFRIMF